MSKHQTQIDLCVKVETLRQEVLPNHPSLKWKITKKGEFFPYFDNNPSEKVDLVGWEDHLTDLAAIHEQGLIDTVRERKIVQKILETVSKDDLEWLLSNEDVRATVEEDFSIMHRSR